MWTNQASIPPFGPIEISVHIQRTLEHPRYHLADVPLRIDQSLSRIKTRHPTHPTPTTTTLHHSPATCSGAKARKTTRHREVRTHEDWAICAPAAILGSGCGFFGAFSRLVPKRDHESSRISRHNRRWRKGSVCVWCVLCGLCVLCGCFALFCFVLFCFFLFCFVLFCFVLFCFVLFCFVLFCFVLFCFVLFCFVLFCVFVVVVVVDVVRVSVFLCVRCLRTFLKNSATKCQKFLNQVCGSLFYPEPLFERDQQSPLLPRARRVCASTPQHEESGNAPSCESPTQDRLKGKALKDCLRDRLWAPQLRDVRRHRFCPNDPTFSWPNVFFFLRSMSLPILPQFYQETRGHSAEMPNKTRNYKCWVNKNALSAYSNAGWMNGQLASFEALLSVEKSIDDPTPSWSAVPLCVLSHKNDFRQHCVFSYVFEYVR